MELDKLHYSTMKIDGFQKPFNFTISEREAGKTTCMAMKMKKLWLQGKTSLVIRRLIADITDIYINDFENVLNKFLKEGQRPFKLTYKKQSIKDGVVDVYCQGDKIEKPTLFMRVVALSNPMSRIKSLMLPNIGCVFFDEFICNTKMKEKYLDNEDFKFKELYNTFQRESQEMLRCYFFGNPYSHYNPYFVWLKVDTSKLKQGALLVGETWAIECYQLLPELKQKILEKNPLYIFDDSYKKYAFDGCAVNDSHIRIKQTCPKDYRIQHIFRIHDKFLAVFKMPLVNAYWVSTIENPSKYRNIYAFDFNQLIEKTQLLDRYDKLTFAMFKSAVGARRVGYANIESSYLTEEIFTYL